METWVYAWRNGFAPLLPVEVLVAVRDGLAEDDARLVQGVTTVPPPHPQSGGFPVEAGCVVCYGFWRARLAVTVGDCEEMFAQLCFDVDVKLGEPGACRKFLNWFDETARTEMIPALLREVGRALRARVPASV